MARSGSPLGWHPSVVMIVDLSFLWLTRLKEEQKPQPSLLFLNALAAGGSYCHGILRQKLSLDRRAHLGL